MADSPPTDASIQRFQREHSMAERLRDVSFPLAVRGYDRAAVDEFVSEIRALVAQLEATQTREGVVQKALDEVGVETAGILQRAHETADEIASRSRSQADGRLQRAEREAEILRRDAEEYAEQIVSDTKLLWEERQRLIEDIRQLADEVLATADDAMERVKMPEPLNISGDELEPTTAEEPPPIALASDDMAGPRFAEPELDPHAPTDFEDPPEYDPAGTQPYEVPALDDDESEPDDRAGGTVELEALPGGAEGEDEPGADEGGDQAGPAGRDRD